VRSIHTEIGIDRPADAVWIILVDIDRWPDWNPFAKASGRLAVGERLDVQIRPPGQSPMTFRPTVVKLDPGCRESSTASTAFASSPRAMDAAASGISRHSRASWPHLCCGWSAMPHVGASRP
jgi:hypothetical protein